METMKSLETAKDAKKTLGVVGLGLIGGSFVKSYVQSEDWQIFGYDKDDKINLSYQD